MASCGATNRPLPGVEARRLGHKKTVALRSPVTLRVAKAISRDLPKSPEGQSESAEQHVTQRNGPRRPVWRPAALPRGRVQRAAEGAGVARYGTAKGRYLTRADAAGRCSGAVSPFVRLRPYAIEAVTIS